MIKNKPKNEYNEAIQYCPNCFPGSRYHPYHVLCEAHKHLKIDDEMHHGNHSKGSKKI